MKAFLGGTTNDSTWRDELIKLLNVDYFDPRVEDWTKEDKLNEIKERGICDKILYVITPRMAGVYSIAELTEDSIKNPEKTIVCFLTTDVDDDGKKIKYSDRCISSLKSVSEMVTRNGAKVLASLEEVAEYLNSSS